MPNFSGAIARNVAEKHGERPSVLDFGAAGDALRYDDGDVPASSTAFVSMLATFTVDNEGDEIAILGAGAAGETHLTTIAAFVDVNHITLTTAAVTGVSAATFIYGMGDTQAFQDAIDALPDGSQWEISIPKAKSAYLTTAPIDVGARKVTIRMSGCTWYAASTILTITGNVPAYPSIYDGGCVCINGCGPATSKIVYLLKSGDFIAQTQINGARFNNMTIEALVFPGNTATGLNLTANFNVRCSDLHIRRFSVGINLNGSDAASGFERGSWFYFRDVFVHEFTSAALMTSHSVELMLSNFNAYAVVNNPTAAWGMILDTDTSGINISKGILAFCGMLIRNTMSNVASPWGIPPEFIYTYALVCDSMPTHGIHFDASLVADGIGRAGKSYHFVNSWAAFSTVDGKDGVLIEAGDDISFTDFRCRVNRRHGFHITGGTHIRLVNVSSIGNNFQNLVTTDGAPDFNVIDGGSGIYIEGATTGRVSILGGLCGDQVAGDGSGFQHFGIYLASSYIAPHLIHGVMYDGNQVAPIRNNSPANYHQHFGFMDLTGGQQIHRLYMPQGRLEFGDGNYFLDFNETTGAGNVGVVFDSGDRLTYARASNQWEFIFANLSLLRLAFAGGNSIQIQNRPSAAGGFSNSLLNSALDSDTAERFNIRGDGMLTWGSGTVVDVILERVSAALARLSSDFHVTGKMGVGIAPETGWNFKAPAIKATSGLRVDPMAGTGNRPAKWSSLGDPVVESISMTNPADINVAGLTDDRLTKRSGAVLSSAAAGIAASPVLVGNFSTSSVTLNYLDHASAPVSQAVITGVTPSYTTLNHTDGLLTSVT